MSKEYEMKVQDKFPNLRYTEFLVVDNSSERLAIDDISGRDPDKKSAYQEAIELLVLSCKGYLYVQKAEDLARSLNYRLRETLEGLNPENTLLLFPGNGSKLTKQLLPKPILEYFPPIDIDVRRRIRRDMSVAGAEILTPLAKIKAAMPEKLEYCVLIDDVVATGATAQALRNKIDPRGELVWFAGSWMTLSPLNVRNRQDDKLKSGIVGYERNTTAMVYQGEKGPPANNSLSSFAQKTQKSIDMIALYRQKYAEDVDAFNTAIQEMRRLYEQQ